MIGTQLGPYKIVEEIGKGGIATVYRAYQSNMDRFVAVKILRASFVENPESLARFQREARMVARLEHIHILPIYDFDGTHAPPYIVMRYLDGGTLKDVLSHGKLSIYDIIDLLRQIASALDYAHRQGVIHRDIKPSNIMIGRDSNVFVADFGLARLVDRADVDIHDLTQTGMVMGTPGYMAPEQGIGEQTIDHRADIYSLGIILFQMLTGELPYAASTPIGIIFQHFHEPVPSAVDRNPNLPAGVDAVIEKAMAKERETRYRKASDLVEAITSALGESSDSFVRQSFPKAATGESGQIVLDTDSKTASPEQYKQVTVLYANLAEYAEFVEMEDELATSNSLDEIWKGLKRAITGHGGMLYRQDNHTGLALWGAIATHENDPERAIRAALEMQNVLRSFLGEDDDDESLPMQIGISTGPALLTVDGDTGEYTVSGTTTSLVQRLERVAPIGSILISHDTFRHVRGVFNIEPSDPLRIRGRKKRIPTYLARSVKPRAFRMGTRGVEGVETNMVGRRAELEMLKDSFYAAIEDHETQVITIVSEPGLGKSRLLYEFTNWAELEDATYWVLQARATPEMTQRPYALLRDMLSFRFEIQDNDSTALVREKMERGFLEMTGVDDEMNAHFIGQLIGFDFSDSPHLAGVLGDAQQFQKQALYYLEQFFVQITSQQPGELISTRHAPALASLEDIHWADESSLGAINHLVRQNSDLPIMIVCLARPELYERRPGWGSGQPFHTRLDLRPLSNRESRRLVKEILQKAENIPVELRDLLVERSEGNPFIMEELIKVLIEDRVIVKEGPAWRVELDRLSKVRVPPTLTGLLQVLLDSLFPSARILLQRAAVVGRIFWDTAIHALDAADDFHIDINASLDTLAKRELIYLREEAAFTGAREFIFGNQMLRDVIYESLLLRQRRAYHAQAAQWMIKASGARVDEYTAMIAEHYQLAGENIQAAGYLQRAGERALRISAFSESLAFFERALALLPLEKGEEARQVTLEVHLGEIRGYLGDYHAARQHLLMALRLARALDDKLGQSDSLYHLGRIALHTSGLSEARRYLDESLSLAREVGDPLAQARAHYGLGSVDWRQSGDFSAAKKNYLNCLELAREIGGHAQMLNALMGLGIAATRQGEYQEGHRYYEECRNLALMVGNQERLASVLLNMGELWRAEKNFTQARNHYQRSLSIGRIIGEPALEAIAMLNLGLVAIQIGEFEEATGYFTQVIRNGVERNIIADVLSSIVGIGWIRAMRGDLVEGLALLGLVFNHPGGQDENIRSDAEPALAYLREKLSEEKIQRGLEQGKFLDLDTIVTEILGEA